MTDASTLGTTTDRSGTAVMLESFAVAVVSAALFFTWRRLFVGMDLRDESYHVLVPWRWALGDRPFTAEQDLSQLPGFLTYPFVKAFGVLRDYDVAGLMLYMRHVYLLLMLLVAVAVFLLVKRLVRWQLALLVACVHVTFIFRASPQLSHNTLAIAFLTLSVTFGSWVVLGLGGPRFALVSGMALGLAVFAYPSLLFIAPFWAVLLVFALGRRAPGMIAEAAFAHPPDLPGPPTGLLAWRVLRMWVIGGVTVLVPLGSLVLSYGPRNLWRAWQTTMAGAPALHQLGGAAKAIVVAQGFWGFVVYRPYLIAAAVVAYLVFLRWPRAGRSLLAAVPVVLWLAAQRPHEWGSGYVVGCVCLAPYLYLFVPAERREVGARLLIWVWAPSLIAGAMTAYTSAGGYANAAVGLAPAAWASGLFLCWALQAVAGRRPQGSGSDRPDRGDSGRWVGTALAAAVLAGVVVVTVVFQFQFQQGEVPLRNLTSRFTSGPWRGIAVAPARRALMDTFAADLRTEADAHDGLLVFSEGSGYYLYWHGEIVANSYRLRVTYDGDLPQSTISYYRRHRIVPTLVVHLGATAGMTDEQLQAACGGLDYPVVLVRPTYAFHSKPADESTAAVLARLPRMEPR